MSLGYFDQVWIGDLCWLHFNTKLGQSQCGDYAYHRCYVPNRSEKIEDGETYIKIRITNIAWKYGRMAFFYKSVNKDGTETYECEVDDPTRLTLIKQ